MSRASSSAIRCWSAPARTTSRRGAGEAARGADRRGHDADGAGRLDRRASSRPAATAIEDKLDTDLDNVFPDDDGRRRPSAPHAQRAGRLFGMGGRRRRRPRRRRLQSRGLRRRRDDARRAISPTSSPLAITDPVRAHDRPAPDRSGRRGRLSHAPISPAVAEKLGAPLAEVEAVLAILQSFDPAGVCARNLAECLAIQLKERDRFDPAMQALVAHLDLLAQARFRRR